MLHSFSGAMIKYIKIENLSWNVWLDSCYEKKKNFLLDPYQRAYRPSTTRVPAKYHSRTGLKKKTGSPSVRTHGVPYAYRYPVLILFQKRSTRASQLVGLVSYFRVMCGV
jgi:hypothetical protein